uniref:Beta-1,4-N-acetylgalactosaminyltransferase n=1 Tax=Panagrellus redivivus TaxID=6233 RepID=A0A7E4VAX9_PANRE
MLPSSRRIKLAAALLGTCGLLYLVAFADLWVPLEEYSPIISNSDDQILAILNSTFASITNTSAVNLTSAPIDAFKPQDSKLPFCPVMPPDLIGKVPVHLDGPNMTVIESLYPDVEAGGHGHPKECKSRHRVAIIVPYRDRDHHLRIFLHNLHGFLAKQQVDYGIFIVEQIANQTFNRAKLMNVGFAEAMKVYDFQCFIFHDVDLLPEDDRNLYYCPEQPRHMSVAIDKFKYKLPYESIFGGISAMTRQHVERINGFSNDYWGWGGEDDDLATRVHANGFKISRYSGEVARYKMIKHEKEKSNPINPCRFSLMRRTRSRFRHDGISNLKYEVVSALRMPLYTIIRVDLLEAESRKQLHEESRLFKTC